MKLRNKKTGEVWNVWSFYDGNQTINLKYFNNDIQVNLEYGSLAELNEEWEDYKPTEPLIKDEKIRKAVRAWAEANGIEEVAVMCHLFWGENMTEMAKNDNASLRIVFSGDLGINRGYINYSITELCGDEEIEILEPNYTTIEEKEKLKEKQ